MGTFLLIAVGVFVALYALVLLLAWRWQERLVFQPPRAPGAAPADAHKVDYIAADGTPLHAFVVGERRSDTPVLLAFHGNADLARWLVPWAVRIVRETGACVVLPEYRGYDDLTGRPTYGGAAEDARAALTFVWESLGTSPRDTVLFGHSLGSAVATELARESPVRALLLQSPFSSASAMARRMLLPGVHGLWHLISRVHYDSIRHVSEIECPVFVAHGARDRIIPAAMGRAVFDAARNKGALLVVDGAGHNDVPERGGAEYWEWLRSGLAAGATVAPGRT